MKNNKIYIIFLMLFIFLFSSCSEILFWLFGDSNSNSNSIQSNNSSSSNVQKLNYFVNGYEKIANVIYQYIQMNAYTLDGGGNIIRYVSYLDPGKDWSDWQEVGIVQRNSGLDNTLSLYFYSSAMINFLSAKEETSEGKNYIFIYIKNDDDEYIWHNDQFVYTVEEVYIRL